MKRREAVLALLIASIVVLALLTVFAIELSNTQAKSRRDVVARVHERGVLAAALLDGLFQTVEQNSAQYARLYGARTVSAAKLDAHRQTSVYLALLGPDERLLAATPGFTALARRNLAHSAALTLIRSGHPYGLGNVLPYGRTGVINLAVRFPTRYGTRTLLTGFEPAAVGAFMSEDLRKIPGVVGARNYVLDGNGVVLASSDRAQRPGSVFNTPERLVARRRGSADVHGRYYDQTPLANSTWRVVLAAPDGPLFASVSGLRKWVPWAVFTAFALMALAALVLGLRVLGAADRLRGANARLMLLNSELESVNQALDERAAELARSNAELDQFASIASHDLQEPLRKVRTFTERVSEIDEASLSERGRDYLQRANAAAARMQTLIEDLLRFSRVATHGRSFTQVDLEHLTQAVIEDLEDQVERSGATIEVGRLPTIMADEPQMRQLMQNLISNSIKFQREGVHPEVRVAASKVDGSAQIVVSDNGIGFDPQYASRIFRVFERLHGRSDYPGTGIGLALCNKIVERHGGTIEARGEPGSGATFTITLPLGGLSRSQGHLASVDGAPAERKDVHV